MKMPFADRPLPDPHQIDVTFDIRIGPTKGAAASVRLTRDEVLQIGEMLSRAARDKSIDLVNLDFDPPGGKALQIDTIDRRSVLQ